MVSDDSLLTTGPPQLCILIASALHGGLVSGQLFVGVLYIYNERMKGGRGDCFAFFAKFKNCYMYSMNNKSAFMFGFVGRCMHMW